MDPCLPTHTKHPPRRAATVVPAILGVTAAAIVAISVFFCARRLRSRNKKLHNDHTIPFQPTRRPTAVRSPSGQPPHYFKKSPSPTAPKPLPGSLLTPPESLPPPSQSSPNPKYSEENEITTKIVGDVKVTDVDTAGHDVADNEYGKLGSLVFKLRFLPDRSALVVSVVRCRGLPGKPINGIVNEAGLNGKTQAATDPYVKLQLLPEKQHKVKTR